MVASRPRWNLPRKKRKSKKNTLSLATMASVPNTPPPVAAENTPDVPVPAPVAAVAADQTNNPLEAEVNSSWITLDIHLRA